MDKRNSEDYLFHLYLRALKAIEKDEEEKTYATMCYGELSKEIEALKILKVVLNLNAVNRSILEVAHDCGWINDEQFHLLIELGFPECAYKEI